jgi:hypothetical protein
VSANEGLVEILISPNAKISENELYYPGMVCFCDIPLHDLSIHMQKYSRFGLAFTKTFVTKRGGAPVYYLPRQARVRTPKRLTPERVTELAEKSLSVGRVSIDREEEDWEITNKADYFDEMLKKYHDVLSLLNQLINQAPNDLNHQKRMELHYDLDDLRLFLDFHVFSFLKFFDPELPDHDPDNYYFEREWRIVGSLKFELEDIVRVFMPMRYGKQFQQDCPDYSGQITFVDL